MWFAQSEREPHSTGWTGGTAGHVQGINSSGYSGIVRSCPAWIYPVAFLETGVYTRHGPGYPARGPVTPLGPVHFLRGWQPILDE